MCLRHAAYSNPWSIAWDSVRPYICVHTWWHIAKCVLVPTCTLTHFCAGLCCSLHDLKCSKHSYRRGAWSCSYSCAHTRTHADPRCGARSGAQSAPLPESAWSGPQHPPAAWLVCQAWPILVRVCCGTSPLLTREQIGRWQKFECWCIGKVPESAQAQVCSLQPWSLQVNCQPSRQADWFVAGHRQPKSNP